MKRFFRKTVPAAEQSTPSKNTEYIDPDFFIGYITGMAANVGHIIISPNVTATVDLDNNSVTYFRNTPDRI